jgi:translocation and assembly module TamA
MICKLLGALAAGLVLYLAPAAAQPAPPQAEQAGAPEARSGPSFELDIRAPEQVRSLLERHLSLFRYREVTDLDDAELARLITLAERDVRELVATLGFFNPSVLIARDPRAADRPIIILTVDPGQVTAVTDVAIEF